MTLFQFLNLLRKEGVNLTKLHVRIAGNVGQWGKGFQLRKLRGNRLSIKTDFDNDYDLTSGHSILKSSVISVSRYTNLRTGGPLGVLAASDAPSIYIDVSPADHLGGRY